MMTTARRTWGIRYGLGLLGIAFLLTANPGARVWAQSAGTVTDDNIVARITQAKTPADHEAIARYYKGEAAGAAAKVTEHEAMVKAYAGKTMDRHCESLLVTYRNQKQDFEALEKDHADMAIAAAK